MLAAKRKSQTFELCFVHIFTGSFCYEIWAYVNWMTFTALHVLVFKKVKGQQLQKHLSTALLLISRNTVQGIFVHTSITASILSVSRIKEKASTYHNSCYNDQSMTLSNCIFTIKFFLNIILPYFLILCAMHNVDFKSF